MLLLIVLLLLIGGALLARGFMRGRTASNPDDYAPLFQMAVGILALLVDAVLALGWLAWMAATGGL